MTNSIPIEPKLKPFSPNPKSLHIPVMSHTESGVCRTAKRGETLAKYIVHQVCDMERNPLSFLCESPSKLS